MKIWSDPSHRWISTHQATREREREGLTVATKVMALAAVVVPGIPSTSRQSLTAAADPPTASSPQTTLLARRTSIGRRSRFGLKVRWARRARATMRKVVEGRMERMLADAIKASERTRG